MGLEVDTSQVKKSLDDFDGRLNAALEMYLTTAAQKVQTDAKLNRPWTDRTNRAREGLTGSYEVSPKEARVVLAHTVDYGVWLELAHEQNWAIVAPTMNSDQVEIINGLNRFIDKLKG